MYVIINLAVNNIMCISFRLTSWNNINTICFV